MKLLKYSIVFILLIMVSCNTIKQDYSNTGYEMVINLVFKDHGEYPIGPYINITIDGKSYLAFLDTGTEDTLLLLNQEIIDELNLEIIGEEIYGTVSGIHQNNIYNLPELIIGNNLQIINGNISVLPNDFWDIDCVLGLSALNGYKTLLSYRENKMYLYKDGNNSITENWTCVDLINDQISEQGTGIYFNGSFGNNEYIFYLDTGGSSYLSDNNYYDNILNREIFEYYGRDKIFTISGRRFRNNRLWYSQRREEANMAPMDLLIGYTLLINYDVYIDIENRKLYIEK